LFSSKATSKLDLNRKCTFLSKLEFSGKHSIRLFNFSYLLDCSRLTWIHSFLPLQCTKLTKLKLNYISFKIHNHKFDYQILKPHFNKSNYLPLLKDTEVILLHQHWSYLVIDSIVVHTHLPSFSRYDIFHFSNSKSFQTGCRCLASFSPFSSKFT